MKKIFKRYYLFAETGFLDGVSRVFDFGGTLNEYNYSATSIEADYIAIASDWYAIGYDMRDSIDALK
ncbi:MAG: hypothetical protein WCQ99_00755 [Pseudomonadota bacterium]